MTDEKAILYFLQGLLIQVALIHVVFIVLLLVNLDGNCSTLKGTLYPCSFIEYFKNSYSWIYLLFAFGWPVVFPIMFVIAWQFSRFRNQKTIDTQLSLK